MIEPGQTLKLPIDGWRGSKQLDGSYFDYNKPFHDDIRKAKEERRPVKITVEYHFEDWCPGDFSVTEFTAQIEEINLTEVTMVILEVKEG